MARNLHSAVRGKIYKNQQLIIENKYLGIVHSNTCRFSWADFRPYCVKTLENTGVFPAGFALSVLKSAPRKLLCTCEIAVFE